MFLSRPRRSQNHMVTTGEEGYRTNGPFLPSNRNWWGMWGVWGVRLLEGRAAGKQLPHACR